MKEYFYKKEYKYIYLSTFFYSFANALGETFGTVMLYKAGLEIWLILLIYGIRFLITGFTTPLFVVISSKIGIAKCMLISNVFNIFNAFLMLDAKSLHENLIVFIALMGLMGLSNPSSDAISSRYVENEHRGRFNSLNFISKVVGTALASCLVAWGVISDNSTLLLIVIITSFIFQYFMVLKIDYKSERKSGMLKAEFKYLVKSKNKYKLIYALRANQMIERLFVPLYIFVLLQDFKAFSILTVVTLILQIITIGIVGKFTDKNIKLSTSIVSWSKVIVTVIYIFIKDKLVVSINKTIGDNLEKVYETSIQTSIQNIIKESKESNDLLSTVGQMSLCFAEFIILTLLVIIALFMGQSVFYLIFILSIISTLIIRLKIIKK